MSRGLGRVQRVCLSALAEAEGEEPVVGRTATQLAYAAFDIEKRESWDACYPHWELFARLSSVRRALKRLIACGMVQENGLTEGYDSLEGFVNSKGLPYGYKKIVGDGIKLYRAPGQRPIHLPDLSKIPPA